MRSDLPPVHPTPDQQRATMLHMLPVVAKIARGDGGPHLNPYRIDPASLGRLERLLAECVACIEKAEMFPSKPDPGFQRWIKGID